MQDELSQENDEQSGDLSVEEAEATAKKHAV